jgi:hypothetical protein
MDFCKSVDVVWFGRNVESHVGYTILAELCVTAGRIGMIRVPPNLMSMKAEYLMNSWYPSKNHASYLENLNSGVKS